MAEAPAKGRGRRSRAEAPANGGRAPGGPAGEPRASLSFCPWNPPIRDVSEPPGPGSPDSASPGPPVLPPPRRVPIFPPPRRGPAMATGQGKGPVKARPSPRQSWVKPSVISNYKYPKGQRIFPYRSESMVLSGEPLGLGRALTGDARPRWTRLSHTVKDSCKPGAVGNGIAGAHGGCDPRAPAGLSRGGHGDEPGVLRVWLERGRG